MTSPYAQEKVLWTPGWSQNLVQGDASGLFRMRRRFRENSKNSNNKPNMVNTLFLLLCSISAVCLLSFMVCFCCLCIEHIHCYDIVILRHVNGYIPHFSNILGILFQHFYLSWQNKITYKKNNSRFGICRKKDRRLPSFKDISKKIRKLLEFNCCMQVRRLKFQWFFLHFCPDGSKTTADTSNIFIDMTSAGKTTVDCQVSFVYSVYYGNYDKKYLKTPQNVDRVFRVFSYIRVIP